MQTLWRWWKDGESGDVGTRGRCHRDISLGQTDADKASGGATDFFRTSDSVCKVVIAKASVAWIGYWSFQGNNVEQVVTAELSLISPKASVWTTLVKFSQLFECSDLQQAGRCWTDAYWVKLKESLHVNTWKINTKWSIEKNRNTQRCSLSKKRYYSVKNTHREISNLHMTSASIFMFLFCKWKK